ncbi:major histocompatibility complex class I-related gene protein-like [Sardina pilchardus]|uniref:major histocompatibility complex class I-related gene protein-like n=1 Tax=Sardina pilchardus TaxID=27697 RepID=UPI002E149935
MPYFSCTLDQNYKSIQKLIFLFCSFDLSCSNKTGSHSLWMMGTYIRGRTPFPEFTAYVMLDDIEFGYYDSNEKKMIYKGIHKDSGRVKDLDNHTGLFQQLFERIQLRAFNVKSYFNHTNDIDVFQRVTGCELAANDSSGLMFTKDAYNGESIVIDRYDGDDNTLRIGWRWPDIENKSWTQQMNFHFRYQTMYHPHCIQYLEKHLRNERNRVLRKVKPRVRLLQKTLPDSGGAKVTCLATGFYPRHIRLTLLRDGQPVSDHQVTGGELLPNGDETYQMRKSLEVSAEELQHHHYNCTAEHLSLDNKLDISLEAEWETGTTITQSPVTVLAVFVCVVGATCVIMIWCWRRRKEQKLAENQMFVWNRFSNPQGGI